MAKVTIKLFATLQEILGFNTTTVEAKDVIDAVTKLIEKYPLLKKEIVNEDFSLRDNYIYLLNGRNIAFLKGGNTPLKESDKLTIFPPVGGG